MIKGGNLAYENPALTDNWDDAEGYYSKYIMTLTFVRTKGYSTDLLDPTQVESKNTIVKSNGLSRVLMLNLWIFSLEKNKIRKLWLK